jgi:hypothetical protein
VSPDGTRGNTVSADLPRGFAEELRKEHPTLVAEIVREVRTRIPEYDRPLNSEFTNGLVLGVQTALTEFTDWIDGIGSPAAERARVYRSLGRAQLAEGRSMDSLQAAYRLGGRVAWRRYARVARRIGMRPEQMVNLAEAVFTHLDLIATASVLGYAQAKADAGEVQVRRRRLLELVLSGAAREALETAAEAVDWPLPETVACATLGPAPDWRQDGRQAAAEAGVVGVAASTGAGTGSGEGSGVGQTAARAERLPEAVLADFTAPEPYLLLPDPESWLNTASVKALLRERGGVVGPAVPLRDAADSLRWARTVRARLPETVLARGAVHCDRHLPALLLLGDEPLVRLIGERRLGPLADLTAKQRDRLEATLLAWLDTNRGSAPQVAARLGVHPQTARHRLHRVQELFGAALADPEARFEIEVALRGRRMLDMFAEFAEQDEQGGQEEEETVAAAAPATADGVPDPDQVPIPHGHGDRVKAANGSSDHSAAASDRMKPVKPVPSQASERLAPVLIA